MGQALLLGEGERVIGQEAVAGEHPAEVVPQDFDDHVVAPARADAVEGGVLVGEDPQPGRPAADLPAGLVDVLHGRGSGRHDHPVVGRLRVPPQAVAAPRQGRGGDDLAGERQDQAGGLAAGDPQSMLQVGRQSKQTRPELHRGRPQGVGGLLRVSPLDAGPARRTDGHGVAEAGDDRLGHGQVDLILVMDGRGGRAERRATPGAILRKRGLDGPVDLLGGRCGTMAGLVSGLAPRPLGGGLGQPPGEGCGLTLTRPT